MKYCAVICEYNPFHNGHKYQLEQIRKTTDTDKIICIMSGDFVQRAEPAVMSKYFRAETAVRNGADAVIQLPAAFSLMTGQKFAEGALCVLKDIKNLKYLAFGCETNDKDFLLKSSEIQYLESDNFKKTLSDMLINGYPYTLCLTEATISDLIRIGFAGSAPGRSEKELRKSLSSPNNILAIHYLRAINKLGLSIIPIFIPRAGSGYNDLSLDTEFASASAIRHSLINGDYSAFSRHIPYELGSYKGKYADFDLFWKFVILSLRNVNIQNIAKAADSGEGLEIKLFENVCKYTDINQILSSSKSKRYTHARIKRMLCQAALGINKELAALDSCSFIPAKLLAIRSDFRDNIKNMSDNIIIKNNSMSDINSDLSACIYDIDVRASRIYSMLTTEDGDLFFKKRLITI